MRRHRFIVIFSIFMLYLTAAVPCTSFSQDVQTGRIFTLETLMRFDDYRIHERSFKVGPDSRSVAVAAYGEGGTSFVVLNGEAGPHYNLVEPGSLSFSPDGKRLAYVAGVEARLFVVVDGVFLDAYPGISGEPPVFSPDGGKLAFVAASDGGEFVVEYKLDDDGSRSVLPFGYVSGQGRGWLYYVSGSVTRGLSVSAPIRGRRYDSIVKGSLEYSPDGSVLAYTATKDSGKLRVHGGVEGVLYDEIFNPVLGQDGNSCAYIAKKGNKWRIVFDGREGKLYDIVKRNSLVLGPDGAPAYIARSKGKYIVVKGGKEGKPRGEIRDVALSLDGGHLAYIAKAGKGWLVCVDGKDGKTYDEVSGPVHFSLDGGHFAYAARCGADWFLVHDGKEKGPYMGVAGDRIAFSPEGTRIAFAAGTGRREWVAVVDGENLTPVHSIPGELVFGPDGRHFANIGVKGANQFVFVDGTSTGMYDGIVIWSGGRVIFDDSDNLHYLAVKKRTVYLVEESFE